MDRVMVFIDYQNVHGWARRQFYPVNAHPAQGHFDPLRLSEWLVRQRNRPSELAQVRIYRGRPNPDRQAKAAAANDRQTARWEASEMIKVIRRAVYYPPDWPTAPASEKGIDVSLAIDLVRLSIDRRYDSAIVFSSDTDLLPAIETVIRKTGSHVEVAAWSGAHRLRFDGSKLPWCHFVNRRAFGLFEDTTDYTAP